MKLARTLSMIIALAGAATAYAEPPAKAPAADKKAPDKAPPKEELAPADAAKVEKFFNEFIDAFVKNQDACPKMAAAVNALLDKNLDWLKKLAETGKDLPKDAKDRMQKRQVEMMSAAMKCKDDKDLAAAMKRFEALGAAKTSATAKK